MKWIAQDNIANDYFSICKEVVSTNNYRDFKKDSRYNNIVGMSNISQLEYWINIHKNNNAVLFNIESIRKNDISEPSEIIKTELGMISPSTMRYINTSLEILKYLEISGCNDVLEIGIGYGGLAYILNHFIDIRIFKFVDLDFVKDLADSYLRRIGFDKHVKDHDGKSDLLISEFCFSEFDDTYMERMYDLYFTKTSKFYLVMNLHDMSRKQYWKNKLSELFDVTEYSENPITQWPNYIWCGIRK